MFGKLTTVGHDYINSTQIDGWRVIIRIMVGLLIGHLFMNIYLECNMRES